MSNTQKFGGKGQVPMVNPNNINFTIVAPMSKDKRMTMMPEQIKKIVIESNRDRGTKKEATKGANSSS